MKEIRSAWPCLTKPAQRYIACFETLAQLALLEAKHAHIGGGHCSFSMPSGADNLATEVGSNKLFSASWPWQLFLQLVGSLGARPQRGHTAHNDSAETALKDSTTVLRLGGQNTWLPQPRRTQKVALPCLRLRT